MSHLTHADSGAGACAVATYGLTRRYRGETALDRVDHRVPEGAVYVLVGANGAGKSTTFKVLMNLERPDAGTAEVLGLDTAMRGPEVRAQVGYVPEHHGHGYRWMTCGRLLQHASAYYPAWEPTYAEHLSHALGLRLHRKVGTLSKGEARRLQLVLALAHRPRVLLLDEPTDGLDPVVRNRTLALLAEHLADRGRCPRLSLRGGLAMMDSTLHPTPRPRDVLLEQVRAVGLALRVPAVITTALLGLVTVHATSEILLQGGVFDFRPELSMLPGMAGLLLPIGVWKGEERFGADFFWTLPVDRRRHALTKVFAGWVWLMAAVALLVLWMLGLTLLSGGNMLGDETLRLLPSPSVPDPGTLDPGALHTVRWTPQPVLWLVPLTAATGTYLLASALALGLRHPLRWLIGTALGALLVGVVTDAANLEWLATVSQGPLESLFFGPYGFDTLLTARTESLKTEALLSTGETVGVWRGLPDVGQWATATVLWTVAGLVALWAAASRHRERRRA
jgi:ABC-type Mn2+/Zn2+ transport system ATPase subunit